MKKMHAICLLLSLLAAFPAAGQVSESACGSLAFGYGPFDYRADRDGYSQGRGDHKTKLGLVEGGHFTRDVELAIKGKRSHQPGGDLDYTLRAFPNHHRALISVTTYGEKKGTERPEGLTLPVECYFERAVRFANDDPIVRMLYATYLAKSNRATEAMPHLDRATMLAKDNPLTHYNIGLVYFDMKMYDRSLAQAHRAMELQLPRTELRDMLTKAGHWQDPPAAPKAP
jgi:hypothetical protein